MAKITIRQADYEKMVAHAKACAPEEACGLIGGTIDEDGVRHIRQVYLLENIDHTNEHFSLSPREQLLAVKDMRAHGWQPLGNWHSHPETPSRPSAEDIRLAYDKKASYLILSLMDPARPILHSFHVDEIGAVQETLEYV